MTFRSPFDEPCENPKDTAEITRKILKHMAQAIDYMTIYSYSTGSEKLSNESKSNFHRSVAYGLYLSLTTEEQVKFDNVYGDVTRLMVIESGLWYKARNQMAFKTASKKLDTVGTNSRIPKKNWRK